MGAPGDCCIGGFPLSFALAPLLLAGLVLAPLLLDNLEGLELVFLEAIMLMAIDTVHHSAAG